MSQEDKEKYELEKIRMKKMKAILDAQKREQASQERRMDIQQKIDYLLKAVLMPDAFSYLNNIKTNEPQVYQRIFNELIGAEVIQSIDYLISIIARQGGVPRRIPQDVIIYLERQAKGIKGKIQVKRKDETMNLGDYITKK